VECRQCQFHMSKVTVALLESLAASFTEAILTGDAHAAIQRSIGLYSAVPSQIEKVSITDFEYTLINDVLARPMRLSAHQDSIQRFSKTHSIPNCNAFMRLGTVSTTCSFTVGATDAIPVAVTGP